MNYKYQSEGATEEMYLITKDNKVLQIPAKNYGQKKRRMTDGYLIDKHNLWFGFRSLIHDKENSTDSQESISNREKIKKFFNLFKYSDENQLKELGLWWAKLDDEKKCNFLEIFIDCSDIKRILGAGKKVKNIQEVLNIYPEKIISLARQEKLKSPKLSDFWGYQKLINLPKVGNLAWLAGGVIDDWVNDYITDEYLNKERDGEANALSLVEKLIKGEHSYKKCSSEEKSKFYSECNREINIHLEGEKTKDNEIWITPQVVGLVKGGMVFEDKEIRVSVGTLENRKNLVKKWLNEEKGENQQETNEYIDIFKKSGRKEGIIDVKCEKFKPYWWWEFTNKAKQKGCEAIWELIFNGDVHDKRLCLLEIPKSKSYLREYHITLLNFSHWWHNNKFWAKCSEVAL